MTDESVKESVIRLECALKQLTERIEADHIVCGKLDGIYTTACIWTKTLCTITGITGAGGLLALVYLVWGFIPSHVESEVKSEIETKANTYLEQSVSDHVVNEIARVVNGDVIKVAVIRKTAEDALPLIEKAAHQQQVFFIPFTWDARTEQPGSEGSEFTSGKPVLRSYPYVDTMKRQITFISPPSLAVALSQFEFVPTANEQSQTHSDQAGVSVIPDAPGNTACKLRFQGNNRTKLFALSGVIVAIGIPAEIKER